jgi:hypothetical protein
VLLNWASAFIGLGALFVFVGGCLFAAAFLKWLVS